MKIRIRLCFVTIAAFTATAFAQAPQEKFVTIFGAKIRYVEAGDAAKPVVVLVHGLGSNGDTWLYNIPALAANHRVIALDQVGFGKSDKPSINYRVSTYVDFLDKFMSELKIEKAALVGNSMGGWVSALYAAKYPAKVTRLMLLDAAGYAPPKDFDYRFLQRINPSTREGTRGMIKSIFYNSAPFMTDAAIDSFMALRIASNDGNTIQTLLRTIELGDDYFDEQVKTIKQPTLIVWGRQDGLTPPSDGERLKKDIAGSELWIVDQCGHLPHIEKAVEFNKKALEFLAKN